MTTKNVPDANAVIADKRRCVTTPHCVKTVSTSRREFFNQRFVYCVISQRAGGLSIGVNMNPDQHCNFNCVYCEVDRSVKSTVSPRIDLDVMIAELQNTLQLAHSPSLRETGYRDVPGELLTLKEVALSGDGEPTLCPNFSKIVEPIMHLRTLELFPFFKVVLITNCCGLHLSDVQAGVALFDPRDEVWAKLDAGSQAYMDMVNQPDVPMEFVLNNILSLAQKRPVIIQSLFAQIGGVQPTTEEVTQFAGRLRWLRESGANIPLVQLYSAHRPAVNKGVTHLPLRTLSAIAKRVREISGLKTEVF